MRQNEQEDGVRRMLAESLPVGVWSRFLLPPPLPPGEPHHVGKQGFLLSKLLITKTLCGFLREDAWTCEEWLFGV